MVEFGELNASARLFLWASIIQNTLGIEMGIDMQNVSIPIWGLLQYWIWLFEPYNNSKKDLLGESK